MTQLHITAEVPTGSLDGGADIVVLVVSGEIDFGSCSLLRTSILSHIGAGRRRLVVDLSAVSFLDSMAIGVLVGTVSRLRATGGGSLVVVCTAENKRVLRIFEISGVAEAISVYRSREDAVRALTAAWMIELPRLADAGNTGAFVERPPAPAPRSAADAARSYSDEAAAASGGRPWRGARASLGGGVDKLA